MPAITWVGAQTPCSPSFPHLVLDTAPLQLRRQKTGMLTQVSAWSPTSGWSHPGSAFPGSVAGQITSLSHVTTSCDFLCLEDA